MATGCLSMPQVPRIAGLEEFSGKVYHTAHWPEEGVDFAGRRVGVIGTGSSAVQAIPEIAKQAEELLVFQRTPSFSVPAQNAPLTPDKLDHWKANCESLRRVAREETLTGVIYDFATKGAQDVENAAREAEFEARWQKGGANFAYAFTDLNRDEVSNGYAADFVRRKIRDLVRDPEVAEALCPNDYPIFAKRICVDTDYYVTFNRPNVTLVDIRKAALDRITPTGVRTAAQDYPLDALVLATGFDAITGALDRIDIRGTGGRSLKEAWSEGPRTYLGLMAAGFPNLFSVTGPGSPSVLSNVIAAIEQHVEWIADCLTHMRIKGARTIEPSVEAVDGWVAHVNEVASTTLFPKAASWYMGANIPGKPRVFMPYIGVGAYRRKCKEIVERGYEGFVIANAPLGEAVA
jgi:cyclohexanone monooxygenase